MILGLGIFEDVHTIRWNCEKEMSALLERKLYSVVPVVLDVLASVVE